MSAVVARIRPSVAGRKTVRAARRDDLDRARGLAIVLVVFGHLVARQGPDGVTWYEPLRGTIYLFHMPFFLYLSGTAAFLSGAARTPLACWPGLVRRRAVRLLLPFLLFGAAIVLGKTALAALLPIDNPPHGVLRGLIALVWNTGDSPALSVWYLAVLFGYGVATPLLLAADGGRTRLLVILAVLLLPLPAPPILYLDRLCGFLVFFVAGGLAADAGPAWLAAIDRWRRPALLLFAACLAAAGATTIAPAAYPYWRLALGLLALPALHALVREAPFAQSRLLPALGRYAFAIYLLNTICIGLAKGLLLRVLPWDGGNFLLFAPVLMAAGLLLPIAIKRGLPALSPSLDRLTD